MIGAMRRVMFATVVLAALATLVCATAFAAASGRATTAKSNTKQPNCATFFTIGQLENAMGHGATIMQDRETATPAFHGFFFGFPYSFCWYGWPNGAATEPDAGLAETDWPAYVGVAWGATKTAWDSERAKQAANPQTSCTNCTYQPQATVTPSVCSGCQAYVETYAYPPSPGILAEPKVDTLVVWTKRHNVLWVQIWPAPLTTVESLVKQLIVRKSL